MKIIVQKFGGTSVRDDNGRKLACKHIKDAIEEGYKVVVVVSAMGRKGDPYATDTLLDLIYGDIDTISTREQDMLLSCGEMISSIVFSSMLNDHNIKATALSGAQAGFVTNHEHTNAKILEMKCERLLDTLETYDVVVVAGFQGASTKNGEVEAIRLLQL
jgi:aspartate kinase